VIADSPDTTRRAIACAWCEHPLHAAVTARPTAPLRCVACGSRTAVAGPLAAATGSQAPHRVAGRGTLAEAARRRARRRLAQRIARVAPPGPVLDIGSGDGALVATLRSAGRAATAVDLSATDGGVHEADVTELGGRYAAIVFWQSLGRLRTPRRAIEHAAALLKPDGVLAIAQPTAVGLPALTEGWRGELAARQPVQIPSRALVELLRSLGLEVERADRVGDGRGVLGGWLPALLGGVVAIEARR
jgi:SAM-dependent methyltransferase